MSDLLLLLITALGASAVTAIASAAVAFVREHRLDLRRGLALGALGLATAGAVAFGVTATVSPTVPDAAPGPAPASVTEVSGTAAADAPADLTGVQLPTLAFDDTGDLTP